MPKSNGIRKAASMNLFLLVAMLPFMIYSDGRDTSGMFWKDHSILDLADYYLCGLILLTTVGGIAVVGKLKHVSYKLVMCMYYISIFCGFIISGLYSIGVAYRVKCCFTQIPDLGYVTDSVNGLDACNGNGCTLLTYVLIGFPWLGFNLSVVFLVAQVIYVRFYKSELDDEANEYARFAERTQYPEGGQGYRGNSRDRDEVRGPSPTGSRDLFTTPAIPKPNGRGSGGGDAIATGFWTRSTRPSAGDGAGGSGRSMTLSGHDEEEGVALGAYGEVEEKEYS